MPTRTPPFQASYLLAGRTTNFAVGRRVRRAIRSALPPLIKGLSRSPAPPPRGGRLPPPLSTQHSGNRQDAGARLAKSPRLWLPRLQARPCCLVSDQRRHRRRSFALGQATRNADSSEGLLQAASCEASALRRFRAPA